MFATRPLLHLLGLLTLGGERSKDTILPFKCILWQSRTNGRLTTNAGWGLDHDSYAKEDGVGQFYVTWSIDAVFAAFAIQICKSRHCTHSCLQALRVQVRIEVRARASIHRSYIGVKLLHQLSCKANVWLTINLYPR